MVHLIALFETAQYCDCVFYCWFPYIHLLKTALQRSIFFDVFAILIKRGGSDHAQLSTRQHWFDHVARIHCAFGTSSTYKCVDLVNESDDLSLCIGDLFEHGLEAFFKLTPIFCACNH